MKGNELGLTNFFIPSLNFDRNFSIDNDDSNYDYMKYLINEPILHSGNNNNNINLSNKDESNIEGQGSLHPQEPKKRLETNNKEEPNNNINVINLVIDSNNIENNNNKKVIDKLMKEDIQKRIKNNIYIKRPFKEKKKLGRKIKSEKNLGEHNKFSDDNIQKKLKNAILNNLFEFVNEKIKFFYSDDIKGKARTRAKLLLKLKQKVRERDKVEYNKLFLNKTLSSIFSEEISSKYSRFNPNHNKDLIQKLLNEEDKIKNEYFKDLFNLTFMDALNHFRGTAINEKLNGLKTFDDYCKSLESEIYNDEYKKVLKFYLMNYEKEILRKRARRVKKHFNKWNS